jgi:hypothetical protein
MLITGRKGRSAGARPVSTKCPRVGGLERVAGRGSRVAGRGEDRRGRGAGGGGEGGGRPNGRTGADRGMVAARKAPPRVRLIQIKPTPRVI